MNTPTLMKLGIMTPPAAYQKKFLAFMSFLDGTTYSPCHRRRRWRFARLASLGLARISR